jgi:hypothetical protein
MYNHRVGQRIRKLVIGLVLSLAGGEANALFYGNDVHQWCRNNRSMALAYAAALTDQAARILHTLGVTLRSSPEQPRAKNDLTDATLDLAKGLLVGYCIPDQVTMEQVTDVFCSYLRDTPQDRHVPATFLFQNAMQKAWPCPKL